MACILVNRLPDDSEQYWLNGTGWQSAAGSATTYSSKEASMVDGETQREALGPGARIIVKDQVTGEEHAIPALS